MFALPAFDVAPSNDPACQVAATKHRPSNTFLSTLTLAPALFTGARNNATHDEVEAGPIAACACATAALLHVSSIK